MTRNLGLFRSVALRQPTPGDDDDAMLNQIRDVLDHQGALSVDDVATHTGNPCFHDCCARRPGPGPGKVETGPAGGATAGRRRPGLESVRTASRMIYEALTSGVRVGLLAVPRIRPGRVALRRVEQPAGAGQVGAAARLAGRHLVATPGPVLTRPAAAPMRYRTMVQRQLTVPEVLPALRSGGWSAAPWRWHATWWHGHRSLAMVSAGGGMVDQLTGRGFLNT